MTESIILFAVLAIGILLWQLASPRRRNGNGGNGNGGDGWGSDGGNGGNGGGGNGGD